jgi:uncharacterized protein DUF6544
MPRSSAAFSRASATPAEAMAPPLERYVEVLGGPTGIDFVEASGQGGIRQPVAGPFGYWLPMTWSLHLVPGSDFVFLARARVAGIPLRSGGDELRDGRGRIRIGRRVIDGEGADRAQHTALWAWSLLFEPRFALERPGVMVEPAGRAAVRLAYPYRTETWECTLRFEAASGLLHRLEAHRDDAAMGRARRWSVEVERWTSGAGRTSPERLLTRWDEVPALRMHVARTKLSVEGTR